MAVEADKATYCNEDLKLLESGNFSDAVITCWSKTWRVHKSIVCQRSGYFNQAFKGHFQETTDGQINIRDENAEILDLVLAFIYTGNYSTTTTSATQITSASDHAQLYVAGRKYQVPPLEKIALKHFEHSVSALSAPAEMDDLKQLVRLVYGELSSFDALSKPVYQHLCQNLDAVTRDEEFADLIYDIPELSKRLLSYSAGQTSKLKAASEAALKMVRVKTNEASDDCVGLANDFLRGDTFEDFDSFLLPDIAATKLRSRQKRARVQG